MSDKTTSPKPKTGRGRLGRLLGVVCLLAGLAALAWGSLQGVVAYGLKQPVGIAAVAGGETFLPRRYVAEVAADAPIALTTEVGPAIGYPLLVPAGQEGAARPMAMLVLPGVPGEGPSSAEVIAPLLDHVTGMGEFGPVVTLALAPIGLPQAELFPMGLVPDPVAILTTKGAIAAGLALVLLLAAGWLTRGGGAPPQAQVAARRHHLIPPYVAELATGGNGEAALAAVLVPQRRSRTDVDRYEAPKREIAVESLPPEAAPQSIPAAPASAPKAVRKPAPAPKPKPAPVVVTKQAQEPGAKPATRPKTRPFFAREARAGQAVVAKKPKAPQKRQKSRLANDPFSDRLSRLS